MKCIQPIDCVIALTYNCNARCVMCDIWKIKNSPEIALEELKKLPSSLLDINLSGGETFLRTDLPEVVRVVSETCPKARIIISSNGFSTALILKQMEKILKIKPDIGVAISIDGLQETHDAMRRIPEGFNKAMATVKGLQKMGMKNLRLGFTVTERNINQLAKVYDLTRELGIQFTHSYAQSSDVYFGGKQNHDFDNVAEESMTEGMAVGHEFKSPLIKSLSKQYDHLISSELKSWNFKKWARAYYSKLMFNFITSKNQPLSNAPGRDFFFLDPSGDIYPSVVHNFKMGNISEVNNFEEFWCSEQVEAVRQEIDSAKIPVWMICTARTAIKKHPFKVGWWVVKNKFKMSNV